MPQAKNPRWAETEVEHAASELAKEYASVSMAVLVRAVNLAAKEVPAPEGRVKLLAAARKNLGLGGSARASGK